MLYQTLLRPLLYRLDAEEAHHFAFRQLRRVAASETGRALLRRRFATDDPSLRVRLWDLEFPTPVGLAAGFDKDAIGFEALGAAGFGFVEVGTLTGEAQPGNPQPRLFRLEADRALINRMGFNNGGSAGAQARLAAPRETLVGVNIGKTKVVPESEAIADYVKSTERLGPHAQYFVVNVSSPNTPGLRDLQAVEKLGPLLEAVRTTLDRVQPARRVPLLVKIAPDLADEDVDAVADLALSIGIDGIIATNTTISRAGLRTDTAQVDAIGAGGLSGAPVEARSYDVLKRLRRRVGDRVVLVSAGGIENAQQAYARICAGASLVQIYTGYIYGGPALPKRIAEGLATLAARDGFARIQDAIGSRA